MNNIMFSIIPIIIAISFVIVFGMIIMVSINGISQWNTNNSLPILTVDALLITKRTNVKHSTSSINNAHHHSTTYYATFEVESKDRIEFAITGTDYGILAERDWGKLTFQGTRYLGFERKK